MLDVKFIRENAELVQKSAEEKGYKINVKEVLELDDKRKKELSQVEELRRQRNEIASKMKGGKPSPELIEKGKKVKDELSGLEAKLTEVEAEFSNALKSVPNIIFEDVPLGGEEDSVEIKDWGGKKKEGVDHLDYAISRDWVDFERGAKVAGTKFYYIKNELALLENALIQFGLKKVLEKGFTFITVPDLVSSKVLEGTGFNPRTSDQSDEYFIEGEDLALIATAEIALTGYHMNEIIDEKELPLMYAGLSACFRKEAGSAGKHTRGLFRVHQFNKLEMYIFCLPEKSKEMHEMIRETEEEIWQELGIPYRVINIAAGDLGSPAAKKYDIEYWSPVDQTYRELTSCSNCTDFQARNLNIRVRREDGSVEVLHTLNGTAVSLARTMVAVIENYAEKDGKLKVPEVLKPYLNNKEEI
ncbi:serine--tRNA ligase [Candidatus Saccharibacteria bacterium]|nr:serine--tRNA ligase [Candidatus Saccharibacteria bacterium]MBQ3320757.1 serine--tRNA ligase [Candidatus Saccharibacteria bacterium]MBR0372416.1 serine--tRNA ligase [Candidatus Saccharibacteria bacterium]